MFGSRIRAAFCPATRATEVSFDFQSSAAFKATTDAQREARARPVTARSATLRPAVDELITLSAAAVFYSRRIARCLQVAWHKNVGKRLRIKAKPRSTGIFGDYGPVSVDLPLRYRPCHWGQSAVTLVAVSRRAGRKADRSIGHFSFDLPSSALDVSSKRSASKVELQRERVGVAREALLHGVATSVTLVMDG